MHFLHHFSLASKQFGANMPCEKSKEKLSFGNDINCNQLVFNRCSVMSAEFILIFLENIQKLIRKKAENKIGWGWNPVPHPGKKSQTFCWKVLEILHYMY